MKHTLVIPCAYPPYMYDCIVTCKLPPANILIRDNARHENKGVAGTWNLGIDKMRKDDADWLIVMSAAMRFGELGGQDMIEQLEKHPHADVIHFAEKQVEPQRFVRGESFGIEAGNFSWHCTAINKRVIESVGKFDANFFPLYFEDIDYDLRINKAIDYPEWWILPIDAYSKSLRHAVELGGVESHGEPLAAYFRRKWGCDAGSKYEEYWDHPFNNTSKPLSYYPTPDDPLSIYNNELKES